MAFGHGKDAVFKLANVAGSTVDISSYVTSVTLTTDRDEVDVTTLGATYRDFLAGIQDATLDIEGVWDPTPHAQLFALGTASGMYWEYAPQGTASGKIKLSGSATRGAYDMPTSVDDAVTFTCAFHVKGAVTSGTY